MMAMEFRSADLTDIAACVVEELRPEAQRKHIDPALSAAVIPRLTVDPRERQVAVWVPMVMLATGRLVVRIKVSCQITFRARSRRCRSCLPVSRHATRTAVLIRGQVPSRLEVLAQVTDPRRKRAGGSRWRSCWR